MSILRHLRRLQFIDFLIRKKATGNPECFAKKNKLSKRGLANVIEEMKQLGFSIKYDRARQTYFYDFETMAPEIILPEDVRILGKTNSPSELLYNFSELCFSEESIFSKC